MKTPYFITAYGLAVKHGFKGTEEQWVASLKAGEVQLRVHLGVLEWKLSTETEDLWRTLMDLSDIENSVEYSRETRAAIAQMVNQLGEKLEGLRYEVNVSHDGTGYVADKKFGQIQQAVEQGKTCVCLWNGARLPMVYLDPAGMVYFAATCGDVSYLVTIRATNSVDAKMSAVSGGGGVLTVKATEIDVDAGTAVLDKSFAEIRAAIDAGQVVQCVFEDIICPIYRDWGDSVIFGRLMDYIEIQITVWSDGTVDWGAYDPFMGLQESLEVATENMLGGVMPVTKTEDMTQSVGVDDYGRLWTSPSVGGVGVDGWQVVRKLTLEQPVKTITVTEDADGNPLSCNEVVVTLSNPVSTSNSNLYMSFGDGETETSNIIFGKAASTAKAISAVIRADRVGGKLMVYGGVTDASNAASPMCLRKLYDLGRITQISVQGDSASLMEGATLTIYARG